MHKVEPVSVNDLLLDLKNPRFPESVDTQRQAINKMLEIQKDRIVKLAKDISEKGLDPSDIPIVVKDDEGFVVVEGNRRVVALKLISNPNLSDDEKLKRRFEQLKKSSTINISKISCVVFDSDSDSYHHWVSLKHTGQNSGVGRVDWTAPETARHMALHGKYSIANQMYDFIDTVGVEYEEIIKNKKNIYITNIGRLFDDPHVRKRFSLEIIDGFIYCSRSYKEFVAEYKKILNEMIQMQEHAPTRPSFTVERIRLKPDRAMLLTELDIKETMFLLDKPWKVIDGDLPERSESSPEDLREKDNVIDLNEQGVGDISSGNNAMTEPKPKPKPEAEPEAEAEPKRVSGYSNTPKADRNNIIPSGLKLNFGVEKKCSRIFHELKSNIKVSDAPNSTAVMVRVFLELSVNSYIEKNALAHKVAGREPGLHDKVVMCTEHLFTTKAISGSKRTAIMAFSSQMTKSAGSLQQYVHNKEYIATKEYVNTEWDNFQPLFEAIWTLKK